MDIDSFADILRVMPLITSLKLESALQLHLLLQRLSLDHVNTLILQQANGSDLWAAIPRMPALDAISVEKKMLDEDVASLLALTCGLERSLRLAHYSGVITLGRGQTDIVA